MWPDTLPRKAAGMTESMTLPAARRRVRTRRAVTVAGAAAGALAVWAMTQSIGGTQLAIRVLDIPSASLPWVATVLGVHWLVFRMVFRQEVFLWLGWFTLSCGVVGLMVALTGVAGSDALAATAIASGLIVGAVMLVAVGIDAGRRRESIIMRRARPRPPGRST